MRNEKRLGVREGVMFCGYDPFPATDLDTIFRVLVLLGKIAEINAASVRVSSLSGGAAREANFDKSSLERLVGRKRQYTIQIFDERDKYIVGGLIGFRRYAEFSVSEFRSHIFAFKPDSSLGDWQDDASWADITLQISWKYGFSAPWRGTAGSPWGYAFGVEHGFSQGGSDEKVLRWGREYFYNQDLFRLGKIRDVYPVNFLSIRNEENYSRLINLIESGGPSFGVSTRIRDLLIWKANMQDYNCIYSILRSSGLVL